VRRSNAGCYERLCPTRCNANSTSLVLTVPGSCQAGATLLVAPKYFGSIEGRLYQLKKRVKFWWSDRE